MYLFVFFLLLSGWDREGRQEETEQKEEGVKERE